MNASLSTMLTRALTSLPFIDSAHYVAAMYSNKSYALNLSIALAKFQFRKKRML